MASLAAAIREKQEKLHVPRLVLPKAATAKVSSAEPRVPMPPLRGSMQRGPSGQANLFSSWSSSSGSSKLLKHKKSLESLAEASVEDIEDEGLE